MGCSHLFQDEEALDLGQPAGTHHADTLLEYMLTTVEDMG